MTEHAAINRIAEALYVASDHECARLTSTEAAIVAWNEMKAIAKEDTKARGK